ncbi:MAG: hypothetical protein PHR16_14450 [Methylovulum sp.]|nr:hypothetical protein [Methylovulum sp.]
MRIKHSALKIILAAFIIGCFLPSCGKTDKPKIAIQQSIKKFGTATVLSGLVVGKEAPMKTGTIKVTGIDGKLLASTDLEDSNHYRLEIAANTELPIILRYYPKPDSLEADQLVAVVIEPSITQYDISPLTTAIAEAAKALGGYTRANMVMAAENRVNVPDANKTSTGFRGDPTKQYGGWH